MEQYVTKDGKQLRMGYTTGSCAAGAAKAAARMLVTGEEVPAVRLTTPKGIPLILEIEDITRTESAVSCAVRKDSGDDPDVTNGTLVYAKVERTDTPGITIDGGVGVGRVTKPGLDQPVGNAAINSTPRRMIAAAVREAAGLPEEGEEAEDTAKGTAAGAEAGGFLVTISIPAGVELAKKTFNPKLGIVGGISVLGTTGIVDPMSEKALVDTIRTEIRVRMAEGFPIVPAAPGNYGRSFMNETYGFELEMAVASSNFIADTVDMAVEAGFTRMLFVGHIGKLVKVAGGIRNTHSKYGDHRMEILTALTKEVLGDDPRFDRISAALADCVSTDEAVRILKEEGTDAPVLRLMTERVKAVMDGWSGGKMNVEVVIFSNVYGELGRSGGAVAYMEELERFTAVHAGVLPAGTPAKDT